MNLDEQSTEPEEAVIDENFDLTEKAQVVETVEPLGEAELRAAVEAILMITDAPISLLAIAAALENPVNAVREAVLSLQADYNGENGSTLRGFELREVGGGWRIFVRQDFDWAVRMFVANESPSKLSQAALETLAVIAYKQPISRGQVASIRAVNVDSVVKTLLSRGLITELFTDSETGAINYGTTPLLLELLGINSLEDLPLISPYLPDANTNFDAAL
ncbi:MAG: SMC-Scp complex subunit ScpB [Rhodoluna sp.]|nr:SMC-Scp complex subunit ScpB [Rhodoluna sp.]MBP6186515.1 SMC-Scp complex subunit ScpB [Rhodoluna sp.]